MQRESLSRAYHLISQARESTAGSFCKEIPAVLEAWDEAIGFLSQFSNVELGPLMDSLVKMVDNRRILSKAKEWKDRLGPDTVLCDILNEIDRKGRERK